MRTMIHQAIDDYIVFLTVEKGASHNTIEAYSNDVRKFARYLEDSEIHRWNQVYLLGKQLPHHWQVWTAAGIRHYFITDETTLLSSLDALLDCAPAAEGSVLDRASNAAWWYYIGGDDDEKI